ncbi:MAG: metallophosphoesterase [Deltaproteobacteria bacterium]|nr:metallophosphoesterase [Deltaproteobacteria bacterium]
MTAPFRLIHLSDLHFHQIPRRWDQWLSRRFFGAANMQLRRARRFPLSRVQALVRELANMDWDFLVITGDLTQLGLEEEFDLAWKNLAPLLERGMNKIAMVPGNHDRYVWPEQGQDWFMNYFGGFFTTQEILTRPLRGRWYLAGWDSTRPTPVFRPQGHIRPQTLAATSQWLATLPPKSKLVVANHYPLLFPGHYQPRPNHELVNISEALDWVGKNPVQAYLHGHVHRSWVVYQGVPKGVITHVNSGASAITPTFGNFPAYHILDMDDDDLTVTPKVLGE